MSAAPIALPARKGGLRAALWRGWITWAFGRSFAALHLRAAADARPQASRPTVFIANHCGWWDGFVAHLVMERHLGYQGFVPMEERNLRRFPSMASLGAFGLVREDPRQALAALTWVSDAIVEAPGRGLWIFPQGVLLPQDARPLRLSGGAAWVAHRTGARLVPVAIRYEHRDLMRPEVFVSLGAPFEVGPTRKDTLAEMEARLLAEVEALRQDVATDAFDRSAPLLRGATGVDGWWEGIKARLRP